MNLISSSWIPAKYGNWFNFYDARSNLSGGVFSCVHCGLLETFPFDILGERITIYNRDENTIVDYCINCAAKLYGDELWDCLRGEKVIVSKIDKFHILKYRIKKQLLNIVIIVRFIYFLIKNLILWGIWWGKLCFKKNRKEIIELVKQLN